MTKPAVKKHTAAFDESQIEISVCSQGDKFYATCDYPNQKQLKVERHPYGATGSRIQAARTPLAKTEKAAVDSLLDLLEKKLGTRPVINK